MVKDIRPGEGWVVPYDLTDVGGTLYFGADDGTHGTSCGDPTERRPGP